MENRMQSIFDAAGHLFINKGYARTQMKGHRKRNRIVNRYALCLLYWEKRHFTVFY